MQYFKCNFPSWLDTGANVSSTLFTGCYFYPRHVFRFEIKESNLPADIMQVCKGHVAELARQCVEPPLRKKPRYNNTPRLAIKPSALCLLLLLLLLIIFVIIIITTTTTTTTTILLLLLLLLYYYWRASKASETLSGLFIEIHDM